MFGSVFIPPYPQIGRVFEFDGVNESSPFSDRKEYESTVEVASIGMFCTSCGSELEEDWSYCRNCGAAISAAGARVSEEPHTTETEEAAEDIPQAPEKETLIEPRLGIWLYVVGFFVIATVFDFTAMHYWGPGAERSVIIAFSVIFWFSLLFALPLRWFMVSQRFAYSYGLCWTIVVSAMVLGYGCYFLPLIAGTPLIIIWPLASLVFLVVALQFRFRRGI